MFDEAAKDLEMASLRANLAVKALDESTQKESTTEAIESVQTKLPIMQVSIDPQPMFDTPKEAIEASKDQDLILLESFKKNLLKYVIEGV